MPISSQIDQAKELTTYTVNKNFTVDEVMAEIEKFYDTPTKNLVWDLRCVSELNFSSEEVRDIASYQQRLESSTRINGKTAIVASEDLIYGLGRMFQSFSEMSKVPFAVMIFRKMEEAEAWLSDDDTDDED
jgi:hypothetical protein